MDTEPDKEILLAEYSEAGTTCRWYEQLTRTTISIAFPSLIALCGYLESVPKEKIVTIIILSTAGIIFALISINTILRQRAYYTTYINRAKEIESELNMQLYNLGSKATKPCATFSNKCALCFSLSLFALYFFSKGIVIIACGL